jgi:formylglycine-generating enzyme required for sulfatase activity
VGSFQIANPFGLFDMHGNVWEWCLDHWHENYDNAPTNGDAWLDSSENQTRVLRGGSLLNDPSMCRSSSRFHKSASETFKHVGFRIAFSL